jgi:methylenetetrahydrofolate dehydrogenase (NADP+)/methenyltetrahydrofolate cyclohydrolase
MQNVFKLLSENSKTKRLRSEKYNTMPEIIDGEKIAEEILTELEQKHLEGTPKLHIILVGDSPASKTYIHEKEEACERLGFEAEVEIFSSEVEESEVLEDIKHANRDPGIDGILIQLPLPDHIENNRVFETLSPEKDIDCLTPENLGKVLRGNPRVKPCAVGGIEKILEAEQIDVAGKNVVIINNSNLIGKPLSMDLTQKEATVTICHRKTEGLPEHTQEADIVVTATGEPELVTDDIIAEDAIVIDAGYSYTDGELNQETEKLEKPSEISTVPGGLGPVTVAMTMNNLVKCFERRS